MNIRSRRINMEQNTVKGNKINLLNRFLDIEINDNTINLKVEGLKAEDFELYSEEIDYNNILKYNWFKRLLIITFPKKFEHLLITRTEHGICSVEEKEPGVYNINVSYLDYTSAVITKTS
jgi:hypothetical protein